MIANYVKGAQPLQNSFLKIALKTPNFFHENSNMSIIFKIYIYQKIGYLWLTWLPVKDGRYWNIVKMAAEISHEPLTGFISIFQDLFIKPKAQSDMGIYQYT